MQVFSVFLQELGWLPDYHRTEVCRSPRCEEHG